MSSRLDIDAVRSRWLSATDPLTGGELLPHEAVSAWPTLAADDLEALVAEVERLREDLEGAFGPSRLRP